MAHTPESRARAYAKMKKRRADWFAENGPCKVCGSWGNLELDHIDRDEKESHNVWTWKLERMLVELAKCQALCKKCHLEKTIRERSYESPCDGITTTNYFSYGCRCSNCIAAASTQRQARRARRKLAGLPRD